MSNLKNANFKKICSFFLIFTMLMVISINPVVAYANSSSTKYMDPEKNNGVYLVENLVIDGKDYTFTHSTKDGNNVIEISGAENHIIVANKNSNIIYVDNEQVSAINRSSSGGWTYFGPDKYTVSWKQGASTAVIAAVIAGAVGGPVGVFFAAASALAGVSIGCDIYYSGRYRIVGTHVEGEYTAEIYHGNEHIYTSHWSGRR